MTDQLLRDRIADRDQVHDRWAGLLERIAGLTTELAILRVRMDHTVSDKQMDSEIDGLIDRLRVEAEEAMRELRTELKSEIHAETQTMLTAAFNTHAKMQREELKGYARIAAGGIGLLLAGNAQNLMTLVSTLLGK